MNEHRHIWGRRGRQPRAGDLCLSCPCEWTRRGRGAQFYADASRPRTHHHRIHGPEQVCDTMALYIREPGTAQTAPALDDLARRSS